MTLFGIIALFIGYPIAQFILLPRRMYISSAMLLGLLIVGATGANIPNYYRLMKDGNHTTGLVLSTDCQRRGAVEYHFIVGSRDIKNEDKSRDGSPPCSSLKIGDPVPISYLTINPDINLLGEPNSRLIVEIIAVLAGSLFFPILVVWGYRRKNHV